MHLCMIKVQSFIRDKQGLQPVQVELTLWPGLPGIQFLGLPDQHLKESALRIKSAIKAAGFDFPVAQQILVNLRPSHLKKTSRGLDLAVAAAYLWESEQARAPVFSEDFFIYGELGLGGDVLEPEDLSSAPLGLEKIVLTGAGSQQASSFRRQSITHLQDLERPREIQSTARLQIPLRPWQLVNQMFSSEQARILKILAVGEHSALMAGPAGTGKTTVAQVLPGFLCEPSVEDFQQLQKIHSEWGGKLQWRPVVRPHHSTPLMTMIGGGSVPCAGEISRAHGGVLILDELLEYSSAVQEALREPFEEGKMRVVRNGKLREYPARCQIVATTNLCPCGKWTPVLPERKPCSFSNRHCRSYGSRLSGPLIDRFEILEFTQKIGELSVSGKELFGQIQKAQEFSKSRSKEVHSKLINPGLLKSVQLEEQVSHRRKQAVFRVARTLADLDFSEKICSRHWDEAILKCHIPFQQLMRWS